MLKHVSSKRLKFRSAAGHKFLIAAMPISITYDAIIKFDESKTAWRVPHTDIVQIGKQAFCSLRPSCSSVVGLVTGHNVVKNATLGKTSGYVELLKLRNDAQRNALNLETAPGAAKLFGLQTASSKRTKLSLDEAKRKRNTPEIINVDVPGFGAVPPMSVPMLRPLHGTENLRIALDSTFVEHVLLFIRHAGAEPHMLDNPRGYRQSGEFGVWYHSDRKSPYIRKMEDRKMQYLGSCTGAAMDAIDEGDEQSNEADASADEVDACADATAVDADEVDAGSGASPNADAGVDDGIA
jgi:hypothetical protein